MTAWIGAVWLVAGFVGCMHLLRLAPHSRTAVDIARKSFTLIRDASVADEEKERVLQRDSLRLLGLFIRLLAGGIVSLLAPLLVLRVCDRAGLLPYDESLALALSPLFIVLSGLAVTLLLIGRRTTGAKASSYGAVDRAVHRLAFATYGVQTAAADFEDRVFSRAIRAVKMAPPVFVAGLPRAGTTLLLNELSGLKGVAAHTYRDMPFIPVPLFWDRLSSRFRREAVLRERAHGDGMHIGFDSAEAFEEILWRAHWPEHYRRDRILPWDERPDSEFSGFLERHMRKIVLLREGGGAGGRYLSKNNLNISRIALITTMYPDALVLVPFRHPVQQALSLARQHRRFLELHAADRFARAYMKAVGHYEFGANLRPVDFDGWYDGRQCRDAAEPAFWMEYWIAAYRHVLTRRERIRLIDYDELCRNPARVLKPLAEQVGDEALNAWPSWVGALHQPNRHDAGENTFSAPLLERALSLHGELAAAALRD